MKNTDKKSDAAILRQKAEEQLKKKAAKTVSKFSEVEMLNLVHELEVHQIELELQNEELMTVKEQAETKAYRYNTLYDFAPSGYYTLSRDGKIIELNLAGSQMLGKHRSHLVKSLFGIFVSHDTRLTFNLFFEKVFISKIKESCDVALTTNDNAPLYVHLTGIVSENGSQCYITAVDITERKLAEDKLRAIEARHSTMITNISDVIGIIGVDGIMKYKSSNIEKWFGWKPEDLIGTDGWLTVHPDDLVRIQKEFFTLLQKDKSSVTVEYKYKCKDGEYKPIKLTAMNLVHDPIINGVLLNYHDITERKQVEAQNKMMKHSLDVYTDGIYWMDSNNKFVYVNEAGGKAFGCKPEEIIGKSLYDFNPTTSPETLEDLWHKLRTDGTFTTETVHRKLDGSEFFVEVRSVYLQYEGKEYNNGYARDITDRKRTELALQKSEYQYRHLVETMADGVYKSSHEGKFIELNPAMVKILGYDSKEELMAIDIKSQLYFKEGDRDSITAEEELTGRSEYRLKKKNGSEVWVEDQGRITLDDDKNILYHEGVLRDITERKNNEQALRQAQKLESIGTLAGGIAHDFNNLMNAVLGQSSIALNKLPKESPAANNIQKAIKAGERVADLTKQLLAYSGRGRFVIDEIDLNKLVKENVVMLEVSIPKTTQLRSLLSR